MIAQALQRVRGGFANLVELVGEGCWDQVLPDRLAHLVLALKKSGKRKD